MKNDKTLRKYKSSGGVDVYKLPVEAFPNHVTNCYLVMDDPITLLDTASGWDTANAELAACFDGLREKFGAKISLKDVGRLIITHGHIDHFGGVNFVVRESAAELGIHELDASVIQNFKERLLVSSTNLHLFLARSGMPQEEVGALLQLNKWSKDTFVARPVDFTFDEGQVQRGKLTAFHTPGHCPGQVCLRLDDILFTADHVLSRITPNQSPEAITRWTGLGHYVQSLKEIRKVDGIRIGLGGHEDEMDDLDARILATLDFHDSRLNKTLDLLKEPKTVHDVSRGLFGKQMNYNILLAMLETGAHMEYLYERGRIAVTNIEEVENELNPVLVYQQQ